MAFLLAIAAVAYIVYMHKHTEKGTIPDWLHKALYETRTVREKDRKKDRLDQQIIIVVSVLLIFVAPTIVFYAISVVLVDMYHPTRDFLYPLTPWQYLGRNAFLWGADIVITVYLSWHIGRNIKRYSQYYTGTYRKQEKEQEIREGYGVNKKPWADDDDLDKVFKKK